VMGKGRNYEHYLTNELDAVTPGEVWTATVGWSGNADRDNCDIVVLVDPKLTTRHEPYQYNIEAKKRSGKAGNLVTVFDGSATDETGIEELRRLVEGAPDWADPVVAIKFDHRGLIVLDARWLLWELGEQNGHAPPEAVKMHDVRVTESGRIRMRKPELEDHPSATAAPSDGVVLAEKIGIPYEDE
jgi:hypothetical protein